MPKTCDNKSVGILVWEDGRLLMIERRKYNFGFALPAGHQDGDDAETAAYKELSEEVGLLTETLEEKAKLTLPNPCKRGGGTYHDWTIFEAKSWSGNIKPSADETKSYVWAGPQEITVLSIRLQKFSQKKGLLLEPKNLPTLVKETNTDAGWQKNPGLEPPMYFLFKKLGII